MQKYRVFFYMLMLFTPCKAEKIAHYSEQPAWNSVLDFKHIEEELQSQPIVKLESMRTYLKKQGKQAQFHSGGVFLATLANGLKAVFKAGGRVICPYAEVAAYRASSWLGHRLVPPTVLRVHKGKQGSLQFFVPSSIDLLKRKHREHAFKLLSPKDKSDMKLFYLIFGQWDIHPGNQLIAVDDDGKAYLALIDNSFFMGPYKRVPLSFPAVYSSRTIKRYTELDQRALEWIFEDALRDKSHYNFQELFTRILKHKERLLALPIKAYIA